MKVAPLTNKHNFVDDVYSWQQWFVSLFNQVSTISKITRQGFDPTTSQIAENEWLVVKNTTTGVLKLWANDGGTLKSVALT